MYRTDELARHDWLAQLEFHPELGSTNDTALALAARDIPTPLLVLAERQTAGRGRGANRWWSAPGALTFSLVLDLHSDMPVARRAQLALVTGLAVRATLARYASGVELKWPNDVYLRDRKVCGILIEASTARPRRAIVGIGINVNNSFADAPADVRDRATSLVDHVPGPIDATQFLRELLDEYRQQIARWEAGDDDLVEAWAPHCYLTDRAIVVETGGKRLSGRCLGISSAGALRLLTADGPIECTSGVIVAMDAR